MIARMIMNIIYLCALFTSNAAVKKTHCGKKNFFCFKACSFGSSTFGLVMIPVLNSFLIGGSSLSPGLVLFTGTMNAVLGLLTFTPLLLHFLVKRFTADLHYNRETKVRIVQEYSGQNY